MIAEEVDDEDEGKQQQKKAAAAEQAGRSTGPVDRHAQHAQGPEAVDRPIDRNTLTVSAQLSVVFGRPAGRPTVGFGRKSAAPKSGYLRAAIVF